ncbi:hypothetical protein K1W54_27640 [Micromonospora sp. CPCC 205371]|nr:hypothetical protein [Micromonospora sp. CPCC 205371]
MRMWKPGLIGLSAGIVLAVGVGTSLARQTTSETNAGADSAAVRVTEQVGWLVDPGNTARFAGSLNTMAAAARPKVAALKADADTTGDYVTINVKVAGEPAGRDQLQMVVSAGDPRLIGVTSPTSNDFFVLERGAPNFLPPPSGADAANESAARVADTPLVRRDVAALAAPAEEAAGSSEEAAGSSEEAAGTEDQGAADEQGAAEDEAAAEEEQAGQEEAEDQGQEGEVPGIQDVLGAVDTLLQVVNGENVPIDQVFAAAGTMGQVIGLLLGG